MGLCSSQEGLDLGSGREVRAVGRQLDGVRAWALAWAAALVMVTTLAGARSLSAPEPAARGSDHAPATAALRAMPLSFEPNRGQVAGASGGFLARGRGYAALLGADGARLALNRGTRASAALRLTLAGAHRGRLVGAARLPGRTSYFRGRDPAGWQRGLPTYARVRERGVYPGVDLVYYGTQGQLEYAFAVAPGADPSPIRLGFHGARALRIDPRGNLHVALRGGEVVQRRPVAYQERGGRRTRVLVRFRLDGRAHARFELGRYDHSRPLTIDPVLAWTAFVGGTENELEGDVAVDGQGNRYVTTSTTSPAAATTGDRRCGTDAQGQCNAFGGEQPTFGIPDVLVAKLDPSGTRLLYSTYIGGSGAEKGRVAVDSRGRAYIAGRTDSLDFPTTAGAPSRHLRDEGFGNAFVARLGPRGDRLEYSTYLGTDNGDQAAGIAAAADGTAVVTGDTGATSQFPQTDAPGAAPDRSGSGGMFVAKLSADGKRVDYARQFAAGGGVGVALDGTGSAYVVGGRAGSKFATTPGAADSTANGDGDAVALKLGPTGSLAWATFLGGSGFEVARGVALDAHGNVYVGGDGATADFPGNVRRTTSAVAGIWVAKLDPSGKNLLWSSRFGGSSYENLFDIAATPSGHVYAVGETTSQDFFVRDALQRHPGGSGDECAPEGCRDAFVTGVGPDGAIEWSSYLGGTRPDTANSVTVDGGGRVAIAGYTESGDFPGPRGGSSSFDHGECDPHGGCLADAFITTIDPSKPTAPVHDDFDSARLLLPAAGRVAATNAAATREPGEPRHAGLAGAHSVWFDWTATSDTTATFAVDARFDALLDVYTGTGVERLRRVSQTRAAHGRVSFRAQQGRTYRIAVAAGTGPGGDFVLRWDGVRPANDDLADARRVTGDAVTVTGSTTYATHEPGEPGPPDERSVWYRWRAPRSGEFVLDRRKLDTSYTAVAYVDDGGGYANLDYGSSNAVAGQEYLVRVEGHRPETGDRYQLSWGIHDPPPNDYFANAAPIGGTTGTRTVDTSAATIEPGEPRFDDGLPAVSAWYRWTAPSAGTWSFRVDSAALVAGAGMSIYTGSRVDDLRFEGGTNTDGDVRLGMEAGQSVYIALWGPSLVARLHWQPLQAAAANDLFSHAVSLEGSKGRLRTGEGLASHEPGEPGLVTSLWYRWTAPESGPVKLRVVEPDLNVDDLAVFTGERADALTAVPTTQLDSYGRERIFTATAGQTYRIAALGKSQDQRFTLRWNQNPPPNDAYAAAQPLAPGGGTVAGDNVMATPDGGDDDPGSVWYSWTAPQNGSANFSTRGTAFATYLAAYTGSTYASRQFVSGATGSVDNPSSIVFPATAGTTYRIKVAGSSPVEEGDLLLHWTQGEDTDAQGDDSQPPEVEWHSPPEGAFVEHHDTYLEAFYDDNVGVARVEYWVRGQRLAVTPPDDPRPNFDTHGFADGPATLQVRVFDFAGNESDADRHVTIDNTPPTARIVSGPSGHLASRSATFSFAANEPATAFSCRLDGGDWRTCSRTTTLEYLADGHHVLAVRARDRAENWGLLGQKRSWWVDFDGGGAPPPAPGALKASVRLGSRRLGRVLRRGLVTTVTCSRACAADGSLKLGARAARRLGLRHRVISRPSRVEASGVRARLVLHIRAAARRKLRRLRSVRATLAVRARAGGQTALVTRHVKLRR